MRRYLRSKQHISFLTSVIVSTLACSSSSPTKPIGSEDFPNSIGSRWVYAVYDSLTQERDTVEVWVAEQTRVMLWGELRPATRWRLAPAVSDSIWYVIISGDTVRVLSGDEEHVLEFRFMYVFPLEVGSRWDPEVGCLDSTEVVARNEVPIPDSGDRTAYFLQSKGFCFNTAFKEERWFAPGVGLLRVNWWEKWVGVSRNETWELISFVIAGD